MSLFFNNLYNGSSLKNLRQLFYVITPNEVYTEYHENHHFQSLFNNAIGWMIVLVLLKYFYYTYKGLAGKRYSLPDVIASVSAGLTESTTRLLVHTIEFPMYLWVYTKFCVVEFPVNSCSMWILGFVFVDFTYYWFHRSIHRVMLFWSFHQVHHSSNFYNLTVAIRLSPLQQLLHMLTYPVYYLPLALILPPQVPVAHAYLNLLYQFWLHTELVNNIGPLEYFLNTPSHHRVHHGRNHYCIDKNFGGVLIIWDRLFGTFAEEWSDEYPAFGLVTPLFYLWDCIWLKPKSFTGWKNKIKSVFLSPEWHPDGNYKIPPIHYPLEGYKTNIPKWLLLYIVGHGFIFTMEIFMFMVYNERNLSMYSMLWYAVYMLASIACYGYLLEKRYFVQYMELCRLVLTYFGNLLAQILVYQNDYFMCLYHIMFIGSILIWILFSDEMLGLEIPNINKNRKKL